MNNQHKVISPRVLLQMLFLAVIIPCLPLLLSWRWDWWEAWLYATICILGFAISRMLAARRYSDLITERVRLTLHENDKPWDRLLVVLLGLGFGLMLLVVGLDALYGWSPSFNLTIKILSLVIILAGYILGSFALLENRFFSLIVRIQAERGHHVISSGPYSWIRHPGYAGALLVYILTPIFLDSRWALLPAILLMVVLVIRTDLEDKLAGYADYARQVHNRLFPGIW